MKNSKWNKSEAIRNALAKGQSPKTVAKQLGVDVNYVYTVNWKTKRDKADAKQDYGLKMVATKKAATKKAAPDTTDIKPVETVHPFHYTVGGIETWDYIDAKALPYHLASVVKYVSRAQYKGNELADCEKAAEHLSRHILLLKGLAG